jgi:hypothetical protein
MGGTTMRAIKILTVTVTIAASMVVGVAGTATAAGSGHVRPNNTGWCC